MSPRNAGLGESTYSVVDQTASSRDDRKLYFWLAAFSLLVLMSCAGLCVIADAAFPGRYVGPVVISPDGRYEAQVYGSNCGVPCSFHASVDVRDRHETWLPWPLPIDVDLLGLDLSETVYDEEIDPCLVVPEWNDDRKLTIYAPGGLRIDDTNIQQDGWREVQVDVLPLSGADAAREHTDTCWVEGASRFMDERLQVFGTISVLALLGVTIGYLSLLRSWRR